MHRNVIGSIFKKYKKLGNQQARRHTTPPLLSCLWRHPGPATPSYPRRQHLVIFHPNRSGLAVEVHLVQSSSCSAPGRPVACSCACSFSPPPHTSASTLRDHPTGYGSFRPRSMIHVTQAETPQTFAPRLSPSYIPLTCLPLGAQRATEVQ